MNELLEFGATLVYIYIHLTVDFSQISMSPAGPVMRSTLHVTEPMVLTWKTTRVCLKIGVGPPNHPF